MDAELQKSLFHLCICLEFTSRRTSPLIIRIAEVQAELMVPLRAMLTGLADDAWRYEAVPRLLGIDTRPK